MRAIRAELGWAGYGQAIAVLEILGEETKEGVQFQLPLTKATDLKFWSREFLTSPEETERIFDIFEQSDLILPWRDTQVICAPMLGNRLDEWTRRKQKHTKSRPQPEPPKNPEPPGKQQKQENEQNSNRKEQNRTPTPTEQAPESLGRTPESLPRDEAVWWGGNFFK